LTAAQQAMALGMAFCGHGFLLKAAASTAGTLLRGPNYQKGGTYYLKTYCGESCGQITLLKWDVKNY
jgi:hypothetical protein